MRCPHCDSYSFGRNKHADPVIRGGIIFRSKVCAGCGRHFLTGELVISDEFEPVSRLDTVLKELLDESDARAQTESAVIPGNESHTDGAETFRRGQADYNGVDPDA